MMPPAPAPVPSGAPPKPNLANRFVQRALLYNQQTDEQAQRLAAATAQPPGNMQDLSGKPDQLAKAWSFSPSANPAQDFWAMHDQVLQQNMAQVPPDAPPEVITAAHNAAETQALNAIYPYRAELSGIGTRPLEDQVAQAERIKRIVEGHLASQAADTNGSPQAAGPVPTMAAPPVAPPAQMAPPSPVAPSAPTGGPG